MAAAAAGVERARVARVQEVTACRWAAVLRRGGRGAEGQGADPLVASEGLLQADQLILVERALAVIRQTAAQKRLKGLEGCSLRPQAEGGRGDGGPSRGASLSERGHGCHVLTIPETVPVDDGRDERAAGEEVGQGEQEVPAAGELDVVEPGAVHVVAAAQLLGFLIQTLIIAAGAWDSSAQCGGEERRSDGGGGESHDDGTCFAKDGGGGVAPAAGWCLNGGRTQPNVHAPGYIGSTHTYPGRSNDP